MDLSRLDGWTVTDLLEIVDDVVESTESFLSSGDHLWRGRKGRVGSEGTKVLSKNGTKVRPSIVQFLWLVYLSRSYQLKTENFVRDFTNTHYSSNEPMEEQWLLIEWPRGGGGTGKVDVQVPLWNTNRSTLLQHRTWWNKTKQKVKILSEIKVLSKSKYLFSSSVISQGTG